MFQSVLDLLFPKHSLLGHEGEWITDEERKRLRLSPIRFDKQLLLRKGIRSLDCLIAAGSYASSPLLKKAIRTFKYGRIRALGPDLASHILRSLPGLLLLPSTIKNSEIILCPVPLHWTRKFQRGFNQAQILAESIGEERRWSVRPLLTRTRSTGHQTWRNKAERLTAVVDAFVCNEKNPPPCVLLVDDISSTGATLDACAKALKKAGVKVVAGLVVAYG